MDIPEEMINSISEYQLTILTIDGVRGLAIGSDESGEAPAYHVFVADAAAPPPGLPETLAGFPVVVQADYQVLTATDSARYEPARGGSEISRVVNIGEGGAQYNSGTLGMIVDDAFVGTESGPVLQGLSCAHVMSPPVDLPQNEPERNRIQQPAPSTFPPPSKQFLGVLLRESVPSIPLTGTQLIGPCDAAICQLDRPASRGSILEIGSTAGILATPTKELPVRKRGRTTGLTNGVIKQLHGSFLIYNRDGTPRWWLSDQIRIEGIDPDTGKPMEFSREGDSGSIVVDKANRVVGMLVSGNPSDFISGIVTPAATLQLNLGIVFP
ncbi:hypothetical protein GS504_00850 [Rhodococcus hoagii]|nr:hypothetical protein [Prescottella equi]NKS72209.1 hypothetical protein [Prescottella equi]